MRLIFTLFLTVVCLTGCTAPRYVDFFPYDDDGICKPKVALLPVKAFYPEDQALAEYFDQAIRWEAMDHALLFFYSTDEVGQVLARHNEVTVGASPMALATAFRPADFSVEVEVIKSSLQNRQNVKLRIRILDIRCQMPKVILYEVLERSYAESNNESAVRYTQAGYAWLMREAVERIEDVIGCAK